MIARASLVLPCNDLPSHYLDESLNQHVCCIAEGSVHVATQIAAMNALKELLEKKRAAQTLQVGDRKYARQADLEEQRHKRLREEEQKEREEKVSCQQQASVIVEVWCQAYI